MYTLRKNKEDILVINILVYAEEKKVLWNYRDLLEIIGERLKKLNRQLVYRIKLNPVLAITYFAALEMSNTLQGGIDVYLSDSRMEKNTIRLLDGKIRQQHPECHIFTKEEACYVHSYHVDSQRKVEEWDLDQEGLKEGLLQIFLEMEERKRE